MKIKLLSIQNLVFNNNSDYANEINYQNLLYFADSSLSVVTKLKCEIYTQYDMYRLNVAPQKWKIHEEKFL